MKKKRSIGIHDGTFHADEVTACALLIIFGLTDVNKIVRTREPEKLATCEFVCDVGGVYDPYLKFFDHHQASYQGELSSAGMVLKFLVDTNVISEEIYTHLNHSLILGIDAHDNGRSLQELGVCTFSHVVANFNPIDYDSPAEDSDSAFYKALDFVTGHLRRTIDRFNYNLSCRERVKKAMEGEKRCLFFDQPLPWLESFFALGGVGHPALFVVMPAGEHWKLRGIPPDFEHRMQVRLPLPKEWAGLLGEELKSVTGIEGALFCHKGRFTSVWERREDAVEALKQVLKQNNISYEDTF
ncbi:MAG: MYG1 family protein [Chlamydiales bacterium]|nr:MYG1 family protein [Chlamydiales bacterium]